MSLELPREPEPGDPIAARDIATLIRYVRAITPRGGPGIRVSVLPGGAIIAAARRGPMEEASSPDLPLSFWPRLESGEDQTMRIYVRKGFAGLAGGPIIEVAPESGDEFVFTVDYYSWQCVFLLWRKEPYEDQPQGWSVMRYPTWPFVLGHSMGMDQIVVPLCVYHDGRISWMNPGDKLGLEFSPNDFRDGAQDVLVFDQEHKRFARVREVPPPTAETEVQRLQRVVGDLQGQAGFRWVPDIPSGEYEGALLRWDATAGAWRPIYGEAGQILYWNNSAGWTALDRPSSASLLYCSGAPDYQISWVPASDYENP